MKVQEREEFTHTNVVMTRRREEIRPLRRMQVEEDAWRNDDLLLETFLEESESIIERFRQRLEIQPNLSNPPAQLEFVGRVEN